jgi:predicted  nucleic acid-binding Zn-ribbon protein
MSDQKKKPLATAETIKQLEELQARVQGVADMATKVTQAQKEGQVDKKALKETLVALTGMATDLASQVSKLQKDLGLNKKGNLQVVKPPPDLPKSGRGPIRG